MKNKSVFLLSLAFILLLGGAYLLYGRLSQGQPPNSLTVLHPSASLSQPESDVGPAPEITPEPEVKPEPEVQPEPEVKPEPEVQPEPEVKPEPEVQPEPEPDVTLAPDFTVYDKQGAAVKLSDFKGKPIVLNFWASWCGPCKSEMPDFEKAYKELGSKIQFLMINATDGYQETLESASSYVESTGYTFPVYYDTKQNALNAYGIYAFPTTFFINEKGELVVYAVSALSEDLLRQGIDMILPSE